MTLTKITIESVDLTHEALEYIGACTQLRELNLLTSAEPSSPATAEGMLSLTELTALTRCKFEVQFKKEHPVNTELVRHRVWYDDQ